MLTKRASGVLLHPTCLPGPYGIGDFGNEARQFIDFLANAKQKLWQVLPIGPCGLGSSPYMTYGSMAGNPLLISPDRLIGDGFVDRNDLKNKPDFPNAKVDYQSVTDWKTPLFQKAFERFLNPKSQSESDRVDYNGFCNGNAKWLDDYALFSALKDFYNVSDWTAWPKELVKRKPKALEKAKEQLAVEIDFHKFIQFIFDRQWSQLKHYAHGYGIKIIGDLPIYVAHQSSDVWANQDVFQLNPETGESLAVAGVPPDYFSETGQLWGNPLYNWEYLQSTGFNWWIKRLQKIFENFDIVRIDHFRGLEAYWSVPANEKTAIKGQWVSAPGKALLNRIQQELGHLHIIAEDLGVITPEVAELRDHFKLPGMKILQFAFGSGPENSFLPSFHTHNCVVYTGTHDNNTSIGWFNNDASEAEKTLVLQYLDKMTGQDINWDLIRLAMSSVAERAIFPLQEILGLGADARMNRPSTVDGNWSWRYEKETLTQKMAERLEQITVSYGRACCW